MSVIISPIITNAGLGVFTPMATGIEFTFTHVAVGTGTSAVTAAATTLENEIARFPIAGGGIVTGGQAVSINALITNHANANPQDYDITEFGFYGVDSNTNTVLFAIYRTNTAIVSKVSGADISAPFVMGLAALPTNNMTVQIDTNASAMLALLGQHVAANHPHTQYKRTLDNTERLKVANAVDNDDAVSKGQLDNEATARANGDLAVLGQLNSVVFMGGTHTTLSGAGNVITLAPKKTIRVILVGGGGGGGAGGGGGSGYGDDGEDGGDTVIYPTGDAANFFAKAKGGLGGDGAYGGNGSAFAIGGSPDGQGVEINNLYDVVILSYEHGLKGNYDAESAPHLHPSLKKLAQTNAGQGKRGTSDGYYAIGGGGSSGAFVECIVFNRGTTPLSLTVDCGVGGTGGVGLNQDSTAINGIAGSNGICVVIHE